MIPSLLASLRVSFLCHLFSDSAGRRSLFLVNTPSFYFVLLRLSDTETGIPFCTVSHIIFIFSPFDSGYKP